MTEEARKFYQEKLEKFADKEVRIFPRVEIDFSKVKKVHVIGICGTAMGSLAGMLAEAGYEVSGSDEGCYPPMSDLIKELSIKFKEGYKAEHVKGADVVIVGNAIRPDNPEAKYAREHKVATLSLPEATREFFIQKKRSLVVTGTHGKTTTTGMLAHVFEHAGLDPTFIVGGVMQNSARSFRVGKGNHFIIEGDEYDTSYFDKAPKFLHYKPTSAIITSLEFDHIDIYKDMQEYTQAFKFLVQEIPSDGTLFICGDEESVRNLGQDASAEVEYYGLKEHNTITAKNIILNSFGQEFDLYVKGEKVGTFAITLNGKHNLLNALSVCGVALKEGISIDALRAGLKTFTGMKRRQEVIAEINGITLIDDFAHHPTAVRETIKAIKEKYPDRRVVAMFEPRSNTSRRKLFEQDYIESFDQVDFLCLKVPPLRHNDTKEDFIDADKVVAEINKRGPEAHLYKTTDELIKDSAPSLRSGDIVLIMSNGSFDALHSKLIDTLENQV